MARKARVRGDFYWDPGPEHIAAELESWVAVNIYSRAEKRAEKFAAEIEAWMKQNASWEDQTGLAREELYARAVKEGHNIIITMGHGVDYGVWLELMQAGRFAILSKTTIYFARQMPDRMLKG